MEECERLFCATLKAVFLGEGITVKQNSLVMDAHTVNVLNRHFEATHGCVNDWIEVWDYTGDTSFRGFVAGKGDEKSLFIFFDDGLVGKDLKHGYVIEPSRGLSSCAVVHG